MRLILSVVIFNFLVFDSRSFVLGLNGRLNPEDPVLINFRKLDNSTRMRQKNYLPPDTTTEKFLPEVIDGKSSPQNLQISSGSNSVVIDSVTKIDLTKPLTTSNDDFQGQLLQDRDRDGRHFIYPIIPGRYSGSRSATIPKSTPKSQGSEVGLSSDAIRVNEMSCRYSEQDIYFRASLVPFRKSDHPVVENVKNEACRIVKVKAEYRLKFEKDNFWACGVTDCSTEAGTFFCLTIRFPTISGLRLKDDNTITLQCRTQDKTASRTTQINVKTLNTAARMAPRVAAGGLKNAFQTDVGLFRKSYGSENLFDQKINPGGTVVLGEEILLRALVRDGDGWKYSRIGEVNVQYIETRLQPRVMNSLWILDSEGCRNPEIPEICPNDQYRVAPLESYLIFEAFMFENMKETDEMILSIKVTGCLEGQDCGINCPKDHLRRSRSIVDHQEKLKANVTDWRRDFAFKVVRKSAKAETSASNEGIEDLRNVLPYFLTLFVLVISVCLLCMMKNLLKQRNSLGK
ncbi:uncharacterized protein LOC105687923 [Athalia rosae]|uniref:uncharacterized protein LOC105687923 n=1 Tax=Athalia rosae TaxID=37344 RepID=UPI0020349A8D|nr:uncharacterized protein LOC105687923 [Athalia rosae]